jgi:hypothetical protein
MGEPRSESVSVGKNEIGSPLLSPLRPEHDLPAKNVNLPHNLARILNKGSTDSTDSPDSPDSPDSELNTSRLLPDDVIGLAAFSSMISISKKQIPRRR